MDDIRYQGQFNDQDQDTQSLSVQSDTAYDRDDDELAGLIAVAGNALPILPDSNSLSRRLAMFCDEAFIRKIAEQLESNERPIPRMIGQLEILDSLGKGGMGQVFRARHVKLNKIQAVKVLLAHRLDSPEAVSRFDQEIQAIGRLEHPNIVAAHDAGNQDGVPYLVMDYVNGSSLHTIVRDLQRDNRRLSCGVAAKIIHQAASAMHYAHRQGIIHRDIKPGNLMIDRQGQVRVMDLGLARVTTLPEGVTNIESPELTRDGQIVGTPDFMPAEQLKDSRTVDERADVYALGATFYLLLTGSVPFPTESPDLLSKITAILHDPPPLPSKRRQDVPTVIDQIVVRCLAKKPEDRFASMAELAAALDPLALGDVAAEVWPSQATERISTTPTRPTTSTKPSSNPASGKRPPASRWYLAASAAASFIVLLGFLIKLSLPGGGELVIRSESDDVRVSAKLVGGDDSQDIQLTAGQPTTAKLKLGTWEITLDGIHATEFRLSQNRVEVLDGETVTVSVTRRPSPSDNVTSDPIASTIPSTSIPSTSIQVDSSKFARPTSNKTSENSRTLRGLLPQPMNQSFDWQMQLIRHVGTAAANYPRQAIIGNDPQGKLVAWSNGIDVVVVSTESDRVEQFISAPTSTDGTTVPWNSVKFSPDGERLALCSLSGNEIQIRSRDGLLLSRFASPVNGNGDVRIDWMRHSHQLLIWSIDSVQIVNFSGEREHELDLTSSGEVRAVAIHPRDGSVLVACVGERLRRWSPADTTVEFVSDYECPLQSGAHALHNHLCWSPDGEMFLVVDETSSVLYRSVGKLIAKIDEPIEFASWDPSGKFLAGGNLKLYRAETLEMIRQLELDESDPCVHKQWGAPIFIPFWNATGEITFCSNLRGYGSSVRSLGEIRKFHPAGNALPAPRWPHPLVPGSASFVGDGHVFTVYEANILNNLLIIRDVTGKQTVTRELERDEPYLDSAAVSWDPATANFLIRARYKQNHIYDRNGDFKHELPGVLHKSAWSNSGSILAVVQASENQNDCRLVVYDGESIAYSSPILADGYGWLVDWSSDNRWVAWQTFEPAAQRSTLNVLDFKTKKIAFEMDAGTHPQEFGFAFSPNSRYLAFEHRPTLSSSVANLLRLDDGHRETRKTDIPVETDIFRVTWSEDSTHVLMRDIYSVSKDMKLDSVEKVSGLRWRGLARFITNQNLLLTQLKDNRVAIKSFDGADQRLVPCSGVLEIGNEQSAIPMNFEGNRILVRRNAEQQRSDSVMTIDAESASVEWLALAYDRGESLALAADGNVLQGPADIDRYVCHTIHHPGGRIVPLTQREWLQRTRFSQAQLALAWANDIGAKLSSNGTLIDTSTWTPDSMPSIDSIDGLDCSNLIEITDEELAHLTHFVGLRSLNLTNCPITNLPDLATLKKLEIVILAGTGIANLDSLQNCQNLKSLDLSRTKITAMIGRPVGQLKQLETLSFDETNIDSFTLQDLGGLTKLKTLSLIGVELTGSDVEGVKRLLPSCDVIHAPVDIAFENSK